MRAIPLWIIRLDDSSARQFQSTILRVGGCAARQGAAGGDGGVDEPGSDSDDGDSDLEGVPHVMPMGLTDQQNLMRFWTEWAAHSHRHLQVVRERAGRYRPKHVRRVGEVVIGQHLRMSGSDRVVNGEARDQVQLRRMQRCDSDYQDGEGYFISNFCGHMDAKHNLKLWERYDGAQGGKGTAKKRAHRAIGQASKEARSSAAPERCIFVSVRRHLVVDQRCARAGARSHLLAAFARR